jgi:hypothetical protein
MFMRIITGVFSFALLLLTLHATQAQDAKTNAELLKSAPNGCGAGWSIYLVPDSIPVAQCRFKAACDAHDNCYGKCEGRARDPKAPECEYLRCRKGGDLDGASVCETSAKFSRLAGAAIDRRRKCDVSLGQQIREDNKEKWVCAAFAYVYEHAVKTFGDAYFQGLDAVAGNIKQPKEEYDAAIREFFRQGTPAEFGAFLDNPPDLTKDIRYVKGKGLVNASANP